MKQLKCHSQHSYLTPSRGYFTLEWNVPKSVDWTMDWAQDWTMDWTMDWAQDWTMDWAQDGTDQTVEVLTTNHSG